MNSAERRELFQDSARLDPLVNPTWNVKVLGGFSNNTRSVQDGLLLGESNFNTTRTGAGGFLFLCAVSLSPDVEIHLGIYVQSEVANLYQRLNDMIAKRRAGDLRYSDNNKHVLPYLAGDGRLYLMNKTDEAFADTLSTSAHLGEQPSIKVDKVVYAVYPPTPSLQRSLLTEAFVGFLVRSVGHVNVAEIKPFPSTGPLTTVICRSLISLNVPDIETTVAGLGGYYVDKLVERFHVALNFLERKHFVILTGLSGTGKTSLVQQYARAVHGIMSMYDDDPLLFICPVRPDWTDPTGVTGYYDVISNRYVVPTFLQAVTAAIANKDCPVFVCLDEMNLARVEYYLSDVLSAMESEEPLQLHSSSTPHEGSTGETIPNELRIPANLYIIGTINIDETTNPISDKVLDRAVVIDMSKVDLSGFLTGLKTKYPDLTASVDECSDLLVRVEAILAPHGLGFGYRVAEEFVRYYKFASQVGSKRGPEIIDDQLIQKILVKLRGTEKQRPMLVELEKQFTPYQGATEVVRRLRADLDELGSFQNAR